MGLNEKNLVAVVHQFITKLRALLEVGVADPADSSVIDDLQKGNSWPFILLFLRYVFFSSSSSSFC